MIYGWFLLTVSGADVGHPAPGLKNQPSVASLVWSYDRFAARYEATMLIQHPPIIDTAVVATCP
jgi:hypothetical protein